MALNTDIPALTIASCSVARASIIAANASWGVASWRRVVFLAESFIGGSFRVKHLDHPIEAGGTATFKFQQRAGLRLHPNQIYKWKREFLENAARVFASGEATKSDSGSAEREDQLLKKIGELTVERDFLSKGLGRLG